MLGFGQENDVSGIRNVYRRAERYYNAEQPTERTDSLALFFYQRVIGSNGRVAPDDSLLADSYLKCGILKMTGGLQRQAIPFFANAVKLGASPEGRLGAISFKALLYLGSCHWDQYEVDSALYYYRLAENLQARFPGFEDQERLYNKMGVLYYEQGDYNRSIPYFEKALAIAEGRPRRDLFLIINYQNNIASALLKLGRYADAIGIFRRLLPLGKYGRELRSNIGSAYLDAGDPARALVWLRSAGDRTMAGRNLLARAWLKLGRADSAEAYLRIVSGAGDDPSVAQSIFDQARRLKLMGDLFRIKRLPAEAIPYYQRSIDLLNPVRQSYELFDVLTAKAEAFREWGEYSSDTLALRRSLSTYTSAISLARYVQRTYLSDESRFFLAGKAEPVYQDAVELAYRLYARSRGIGDLERLFGFMEAGKASVLQSRLDYPDPLSPGGAARSLAKEEKEKKAADARLRLQLAGTKDSVGMARLLVRIRDLEVEISGIQDRLDQYPEYQRRKFDRQMPGIAEVQRSLPDRDAVVLSYYDNGHRLFCCFISKDSIGCVAVPWDRSIAGKVLTLHRRLNESSGDRQEIRELIDSLSERLIGPVYAKVASKKRWVIVPGQELFFLPFEVLHSPGDENALIFRHAISYSYSAHLMTAEPTARTGSYRVLAVAPFVSRVDAWPALSASLDETKGLPGLLLTGSDATRDHFLRVAGGYPVVHLATHAVADAENPMRSFIAFSKEPPADTIGRLYEPAICQMDMSGTRLVILSACRTADGPLVQSEGIISLSRAFSYAGCPSVITSLWKADDPATAYIVRRVHGYLQEGLAKDIALQRAKLDYLGDRSVGMRRQLPEYWAHLILVGDPSPVVLRRWYPGWPLWGIAGVFVLLFLFLMYKRTGPGRRTRSGERVVRDEA